MASVTEFTTKKYTDEELEEQLEQLLDCEGDVIIAGYSFSRFDILKEMDPIAFDQALSELQEEVTMYSCDECGCEYECEYYAECCCEEGE
jgi:aminoglycoside N3'-acetyltransferase